MRQRGIAGRHGLVRVAVPESIQAQVAVGNPCCTTTALPQESDGILALTALASLLDLAASHDVVVLGPGLGKSAALPLLIASLVKEIAQPLVLDADGLNALHGKTEVLHNAAGPRILTPHPGEFARLAGLEIPAVQANRREQAVRFAADHRVVVVLKGHGTVVSDGAACYENTTGNPGMATGGTGDVLAGFLGALLGQGLAPFAAAQLAVYLHGRAGDLACVEKGELGLIASDLLQYLPRRSWNISGRKAKSNPSGLPHECTLSLLSETADDPRLASRRDTGVQRLREDVSGAVLASAASGTWSDQAIGESSPACERSAARSGNLRAGPAAGAGCQANFSHSAGVQ